MKTIEHSYQLKKNEPRLFKNDLKFMDINYVTQHFLLPKKLDKKTKHEIAVRIHNFSLSLHDTIKLYPIGKKATGNTYDKMEAGFKETLRRVKISLALDKKHSKYLVDYWPFLAGVLKNDARLLKDERLQNMINDFEKKTQALEVKK